jgi:ribosome-binding protein aMBF1 (putative translation factor)
MDAEDSESPIEPEEGAQDDAHQRRQSDTEASLSREDLAAELRTLAARLRSLDPNSLTPTEQAAVEDLLRQLRDYYGQG